MGSMTCVYDSKLDGYLKAHTVFDIWYSNCKRFADKYDRYGYITVVNRDYPLSIKKAIEYGLVDKGDYSKDEIEENICLMIPGSFIKCDYDKIKNEYDLANYALLSDSSKKDIIDLLDDYRSFKDILESSEIHFMPGMEYSAKELYSLDGRAMFDVEGKNRKLKVGCNFYKKYPEFIDGIISLKGDTTWKMSDTVPGNLSDLLTKMSGLIRSGYISYRVVRIHMVNGRMVISGYSDNEELDCSMKVHGNSIAELLAEKLMVEISKFEKPVKEIYFLPNGCLGKMKARKCPDGEYVLVVM